MNPLLALFLTVALGSGQPAASGNWVLVASPVVVEATVLGSIPKDPGSVGDFDFVITVEDGHTSQCIQTLLIAVHGLADAVGVLRSTTTWLAPYLVVRSECGGGNAWACNKEIVFKVTGGHAFRIGAFAVGDDRLPGLSLREGYFVDTYDKLELRAGMCHACSPRFEVAIGEEGGQLAVLPDVTWSINRPQYERFQALINSWLCGGLEADHEVLGAVLNNAALAKYCGRDRDLSLTLEQLAARLDDDHRAWLCKVLDQVTVSELPVLWRGWESH